MIDELYINGTRADMSSKSGVYLQYNSCLLSSLDSIDANHSYTIKLPKTANNLALIGGLLFPSSGSTFPSANNAATLLRDGIPLCQDATLYLMGITTDEIQVAVSWGIGDKLDAINDLSLSELALWNNENYKEIIWYKDSTPKGLYGDTRSRLEGEYTQPCINADTIMLAINTQLDFMLEYSDEIAQRWVHYWVPILKRNPKSEGESSEPLVTVNRLYYPYELNYTVQNVTWFIEGDNYDTSKNIYIIDNGGQHNDFQVMIKKGTKAYISLDILSRFNTLVLEIYCSKGDTSTFVASYTIERTEYESEFAINQDIDIDQDNDNDQIIWFLARDVKQGDNLDYTTEGIYHCYARFYEGDAQSGQLAVPCEIGAEVQDLNILPVKDNLPEITCMDFLKGVCGLFGLYPCLKGDKVELKAYDNLEDISNALDWSSYLCSVDDVPNSMDITPDNVGQKTLFKYENTDEDSPDSLGVVNVENNALESEVDFITLPFKNCIEVGRPSDIEIYTQSSEEEERWEYNESDDCYLIKADSMDFDLIATSFQEQVNDFYQKFREIVNNRVITEYFYLDSVVLKDIDMTKPIYLSKYGRYFALMEIKTKENDMAEVKLLTL